jgi:putative heme degradation protein
LGVSEAEIVATGYGEHVTRLESDWNALLGAHDALVDAYRHDDQSIGRSVAPVEENPAEGPDEAIDVEALLEGWSEPEDTHDFFPLLQDCDVSRRKASHSSVRRP